MKVVHILPCVVHAAVPAFICCLISLSINISGLAGLLYSSSCLYYSSHLMALTPTYAFNIGSATYIFTFVKGGKQWLVVAWRGVHKTATNRPVA